MAAFPGRNTLALKSRLRIRIRALPPSALATSLRFSGDRTLTPLVLRCLVCSVPPRPLIPFSFLLNSFLLRPSSALSFLRVLALWRQLSSSFLTSGVSRSFFAARPRACRIAYPLPAPAPSNPPAPIARPRFDGRRHDHRSTL